MERANATETLEAVPDLANTALYAKGPPFALWDRLRDESPVHWNATGPRGFWALTRLSDVRRVLRDTQAFASGEGNMLAVLGGRERGAGKMLAVSDGSFHAGLGRVLSGLLADIAKDSFRRIATDAARRLGDALIVGADAATASGVFAGEVTGALLGLPRDSWLEAQRLAVAAVVDEPDMTSPGTAQMRMIQLMRGEALAGTDTAAALPQLRNLLVDGRSLRTDEILLNAYGLLLGASVTTGNVVSRLVLLAATSPAEWRHWRTIGPNRDSIEEAIRWASPAAHFMRTATCDVDIGSTRIREGDPVTVWLGAANRDASVFQDPGSFRPNRRPNPHVGFGFGAHYCTGAPIARVAVHSAVTMLFERFERFQLVEQSWLRSNFLSGLRSLRVEAVPTR